MKQFLFTSVLAMLLFSCAKKETQTTIINSPVGTISDYTKLSIGNYWVYEILNVDTLGNTTLLGTDSCFIKSDSVLNGKTYAIIMNAPFFTGITLERDSTFFLIDQHGTIHFAYGDFNTVLYGDSAGDICNNRYSVSSVPSSVVVPMGVFTCYKYKGSSITYLLDQSFYTDAYYSFNTGLVELAIFTFGEIGTTQYRLIRSHVM